MPNAVACVENGGYVCRLDMSSLGLFSIDARPAAQKDADAAVRDGLGQWMSDNGNVGVRRGLAAYQGKSGLRAAAVDDQK